MAQPALPRRPPTYEDLLKVPDHFVAEILDGEGADRCRSRREQCAGPDGLSDEERGTARLRARVSAIESRAMTSALEAPLAAARARLDAWVREVIA